MSYFEDHYKDFRFPITEGDDPGFRRAQLGAIHATAAHFTTRKDPGIITMPTGSGKTAVLLAAAFVLRAKRVLVITPSRLVREQIAEEIADLVQLRRVRAVSDDTARPKVLNVRKRITASEQ